MSLSSFGCYSERDSYLIKVNKNGLLVTMLILVITLSTSGLWDGWMNHPNSFYYCLPFCIWDPARYLAADFLMTVTIAATLALAFVRFEAKKIEKSFIQKVA